MLPAPRPGWAPLGPVFPYDGRRPGSGMRTGGTGIWELRDLDSQESSQGWGQPRGNCWSLQEQQRAGALWSPETRVPCGHLRPGWLHLPREGEERRQGWVKVMLEGLCRGSQGQLDPLGPLAPVRHAGWGGVEMVVLVVLVPGGSGAGPCFPRLCDLERWQSCPLL